MSDEQLLEQLLVLSENFELANSLLTSIYAFIAFFVILVVGGVVVYFILRPLWFFISR